VTAPVVRTMPTTDPATLRELAAIIEHRQTRLRARLSAEKLEELADMVMAGRTPTIGWWRRALAASERKP
jgi:hypothetical protein